MGNKQITSKVLRHSGKGKPSAARPRRRISAKRRRAIAFGRICELTEGRAVRWRRYGIGAAESSRLARAGDGGYLAYLEYLRTEDPREAMRVKAAARRPLYYAAENARRRALAEERRKVRARRTANPCPTPAQLMEAWEGVGGSHEATLRFGSLLEDLECYVDNSLKFNDEGDIVGRNQGVKGWLHDNAPLLYDRYTTVMRYKAMSKKMRQIAELRDPVSASAIIAAEGGTRDYAADEIAQGGDAVRDGMGNGRGEASGAGECAGQGAGCAGGEGGCAAEAERNGGGKAGGARMAVPELGVVRARAIWCEVIGGIADNPTSLVRRIDELLDPEGVEDANMLAQWRAKYANEITLRTKSAWWRRLKERTG